jgi:phosphoribosylglycinamide formyltransferase-1
MGKLKIGVLISGSGTNLQQIIDDVASGDLDVDISVVISNNPEAKGLERARKANIPAVVCDHSKAETIIDPLKRYDVELVVMAGYMRLLPVEILSAFPNKVMNLHPALLPSFPGAHGIADAFTHGVKVTGVTVHFANEVFDEGPIILQEPVRIEEKDTLETLEARIHAVEYKIYPKAIGLYAAGKLEVTGNKVRIHD